MPDRPTLLLATGNPHKVTEFRRMLDERLAELPIELKSTKDFPHISEPEEHGDTFEANALIKARALAQATGLLTLADDSGLVVDALDGRPGIQSARYAPTPEARIERLLAELHEAGADAPERRAAHFVCVIALVDAHGQAVTARGEVHGRIAHAPHGQGGFGYDPVFELHEDGLPRETIAALPDAAKDAISHRGRALAAIIPELREALRDGQLAG